MRRRLEGAVRLLPLQGAARRKSGGAVHPQEAFAPAGRGAGQKVQRTRWRLLPLHGALQVRRCGALRASMHAGRHFGLLQETCRRDLPWRSPVRSRRSLGHCRWRCQGARSTASSAMPSVRPRAAVAPCANDHSGPRACSLCPGHRTRCCGRMAWLLRRCGRTATRSFAPRQQPQQQHQRRQQHQQQHQQQ